jgi:hypothetical protein
MINSKRNENEAINKFAFRVMLGHPIYYIPSVIMFLLSFVLSPSVTISTFLGSFLGPILWLLPAFCVVRWQVVINLYDKK